MRKINSLIACVPVAFFLIASNGIAADKNSARPADNGSSDSSARQAPLDNDAATAPRAGVNKTGGASAALNAKDRRFIEKAAADGMAEVALGQLAESTADNAEVKEFGAHMVQDHGQANDELKQIAQSKGVNVPEGLDRKHQRKIKDLGKQSGADFDRRYMAEMVKDHEKDLKFFQDAANTAKDPDVRAFAEKAAQTIGGHLQMARTITANIDTTASRTTKKRDGEM
jgi:putative membrane protein